MTAIDREFVTIYIAPANTNGSALVGSTHIVNGEITSHNLTGGNQDEESVPAFGGYITKRKPREQYELQMDVVPKIGSTTSEVDRWDIFKYGATGASTGEGSAYAIFIVANDGTNKKTSAFNNCKLTNWEPSHSADDNYTGTATWKFSPETDTGAANLKTSALAHTETFFNW
jgi:hypothetical protein